MIRAFTVAALSAALAGCGGGGSGSPASAGASSESNVQTVVRDAVSWAKRITRSRDHGWERTTPIPAMVFQVAAEYADELAATEGWGNTQLSAVACNFAAGTMTTETIIEQTKAGGADIEELKSKSAALKGVLSGDLLMTQRYCFVNRLKIFARPVSGWPARSDEAGYAKGVYQSFSALPDVVGRIVKSVETYGDGVTREELATAIRAGIDNERQAYWTAVPKLENVPPVQLDFTGSGPSPVHFNAGGLDFQGGPQGWMLSQYGTQWLSGSHVLGTTVTLAVNMRQSAAMDKSSSTENSQDGTSINRSTQGVEVK